MSVLPAVSPIDALSIRLFATLTDLDARWRHAAARCSDAAALAAARDRCVAEWRAPLYARLDTLFAEMSELLATLDVDQRHAATTFHRQLVQPYFLQSPFARRAVDKPLGYAGDFGLVEMIFAGAERAETPLGALLGAYALECGPSAAHRGRLDWACAQIDGHTRTLLRPRVLSFACGPEVVLREWVRRGGEAEITLADHDPSALAWAKKRLLKARARDNGTTVSTIEANAFALLRGSDALAGLGGGFDVVCVLGLLDYLEDAQIVTFLEAIAKTVRPGGLLLTSNLHVTNPWRALMEMTADWNVAHRSVAGFEALVTATGAFGAPRTDLHASGTNLYCAARVAEG